MQSGMSQTRKWKNLIEWEEWTEVRGMCMMREAVWGMILPFVGTALGSGLVFLMKGQWNPRVQRILTGFAAGVMLAASIWSLIIPAIQQAEMWKSPSWLPACVGIWVGVLFLKGLDQLSLRLGTKSRKGTGIFSSLGQSSMMVLAVTLHNLPEGMAVGVAAAGMLSGEGTILPAEMLALSLGIALQNLPEGAIISMPLHSGGMKRGRAFSYGVLSGAVEPMGAVVALVLARTSATVLPYFLGFAAGAMLYVVAEELLPEAAEEPGEHGGIGMFFLGFTLMMILDVSLG